MELLVLVVEMVLAEDGRQIFFEDLFFTLVDEAGRLVCLEAVSLRLNRQTHEALQKIYFCRLLLLRF